MTVRLLVSIFGNKSTGNFVKENNPKRATPTNISAVVTGFFTADEYKLILFQLKIKNYELRIN
ncbi:hypothetical protein AGMMS50262_03730 [Bacteroidia bacterium]|nr:hypothetical protein AGMMS50262_03730 [Bacteroidia bacterium]